MLLEPLVGELGDVVMLGIASFELLVDGVAWRCGLCERGGRGDGATVLDVHAPSASRAAEVATTHIQRITPS